MFTFFDDVKVGWFSLMRTKFW